MGVSNDRKKRRLKPIGRFLVIFLAFMVTLTTVNALILPAITLNEETAEGEPGIEVADKEPETTPEAEPEQTPESEQEVTEVSETAPEKTAAPEVKEEIKYTAGELVYTEKEDFEITLKYTEEAKLTDKAELQIVEIWERGEYEDYLKKLEEDVYPEEEWEIIDARVFDVHTNETEEIKGKTEVTFEYLEETVLENEEELKILVLNDKDEYIELDEKDNKIEIESKETESEEGSIIESVSFEKKDLDHFVIVSVKEKKADEITEESEETVQEEEKESETEEEKKVLEAKGDTYTVTLTYGEDAEIPEDAELRVREITEDDEKEYSEIQEQVKTGLEEGTENIPSHPVLFNISIWYEGQEIEPAEGSEVKVEIKLTGDPMKGMYTDDNSPVLVNDAPLDEEISEMDKEIKVLHIKEEDEVHVMESTEEISEEKAESVFTTDSFSNWLLYLDEDLTSIDVTTGDSLTLRPYTEWVWKNDDESAAYQDGEWTFPSSDWDKVDTGEWVNNVWFNYTLYTHKTNGSQFRSFTKTDDQLNETYTVVTSVSLGTGNDGKFNLTTNKGKTIEVHVTEGSSSGKPETVAGIPDLKVNLFDYDIPGSGNNYNFARSGNLDVQSNVATSPNNNNNINTNHDLKFLGYGGSNVSSTDNWFWINNYTKDLPQQGIVKEQLGSNGYPELTPGLNGQERGNPSLKYLFDPDATPNHNVYPFPEAGGLFQKDNQGYYYYNSNSNYAEYDRSTNQFILYEHTYSQNTGGSNGANAKPIGFFPFHEYDTSDTQPSMNFNQNLNHHFGMSMTVDFEIPKDRQMEDDNGVQHDIIYEFSGDDDLWVFVDGELALDIGGLHQPVTGSINFTTGEIIVHGLNTETKTFSVGAHTLQMFYLERGGCDSNLSVRFNFPLVKGKAEINVAKKSMTDDATDPDEFLEGAIFGIWENADCSGDPYLTATSDANGYVAFDNLPVKAPGQKFYLKEIKAPEGYNLNSKILTATAVGPDANDNYTFTITDGDEIVETMTQEPYYPIIRDTRPDAISLIVKKEWQDADGSEMEAPDVQAEFEVKRRYTWVEGSTGPANSIINVYRVNNNLQNPNPKLMETREYAGNTTAYVNWTYNQYLDNRYKNWQYRVNNGSAQTKGNGPASIQLTAGETTNVYIYDGNLETQWEQYGVENISVTGDAPPSGGGELITGEGEDTEYHGPVITLPTSAGSWTDTVSNLPVMEEDGERTYYYQYYLVEKTVPDGFEAIYLDGSENPISDPSSQMTNIDGTQTVVNRKLLDIPIKKEWADFIGDAYTWETTFQLEEREIKVNETDPDASDAITSFTPVEGRDSLTIAKGMNPEPKFENLPMYRVHSNSTVYRIEYSVSEIAYKVMHGNDIVAQWSKDGGLVIGSQYAPQFEQDAGEHGDNISDYEILVVNALENLIPSRGIELSVQKTWPDGSDIENDDSAYAKFVLKRWTHQEYRDYSNLDEGTKWVDITLQTWENGKGNQTVHVPEGTIMHIVGSIKGNTNANKIVFTQSPGDPIELVLDNSHNEDKALFDITFTADQPKTVSLTRGDNYVIGGRDGFFLSDTYGNKTNDKVDPDFKVEFTLNKSNQWQEYFEYLPQMVMTDVDPTETPQTVYVYSYYLEEIDSNPDNYSPVFTDNYGTKLGDINNGIDTDAQIMAENKLSVASITLKKVDKADVNKENLEASDLLDGATFILEKYTQLDPETADTEWNNAHNIANAGNNGVFEFDNLPFGIYKIVEKDFPDGYVQTTAAPVFEIKQDTDGNPVIEIKNEDELDGLARVVDGQLVIIVGNEAGAVLPHTGGSGTTIFYTLGSILVLIASAWLFQNKISYRRGGGKL